MATIEKRNNGIWRVSKMVSGRRIRVNVDHKPTKTEAEKLILEEIQAKRPVAESMLFSDAVTRYTTDKVNMSAATEREYSALCKRLPKWFVNKNLKSITNDDLKALAKDLSEKPGKGGKPLSPKTVSNYYHMVTAVLNKYTKNLSVEAELPTIHKKSEDDIYIPSDDDVKALLKYCAKYEEEYYIPVYLGAKGVCREEVVAITGNDIIEEDGIYILVLDKAIVVDKNGSSIQKDQKTFFRKRKIAIAEDIALKIKAQGYAYDGYIGNITKFMLRATARCGVDAHFGFHKLRHYALSKMLEQGVDFQTALYLGGWSKESKVAQNIYSHSLKARNNAEKVRVTTLLDGAIR